MNDDAKNEPDAALQAKLEAMVDSMPAFPQSVHRVLALTADLNCSPKDVVKAIEHDPVMTAKMLKLVNSAFYSLPRKITSMNHAVVYVGVNTVKNMALSIATVGMLPQHNKAGMDMPAFLLHALATASIARKLSELVDKQGFEAIDFFVAGLLHDFGKVVLVRSFPEGFAEAMRVAAAEQRNLVAVEQEIMGLNHGQVGAVLGERWKFPEALVQAIRYHHQPGVASNVLRDCVFASNQVCKTMMIGGSGNDFVEPFSEHIQARLGGNLDDVLLRLGDVDALVNEAKVFASL